ncbi:MAG: hypothetical protein K6T85_13855 [Gorillibacterium sp.]|nr:hypothetical protein [Gorillibacterium sp.]
MEQLHSIQANMELTISMLVDTPRKLQAKKEAERLLNEDIIRLSQIELYGQNGEKYKLFVKNILHMNWFHVKPQEYSQVFRVYGRMELQLSAFEGECGVDGLPIYQELSFPESRIDSKSVLSIPTLKGRISVRIDGHLINWIVDENANNLSVPAEG